MKKVVFVLMAAVLIALPSFTSAGYSSGGAMLLTRLEVSKDNTNWVNYLAEENSGDQTLTVLPGDTVYFRLKTWNTGDAPSIDITFTGSYTNPGYIDALDPFHPGVHDDLDGDATFYYALTGLPDMTAGTVSFDLDAVANGSTDLLNYQSGEMVARVAAGTPDQTVMLTTVIITGASQVAWWKKLLFPRAYADDSATTQVRILVSNPPAATAQMTTQTLPVTGPDPIQLIMSPVMRFCQ